MKNYTFKKEYRRHSLQNINNHELAECEVSNSNDSTRSLQQRKSTIIQNAIVTLKFENRYFYNVLTLTQVMLCIRKTFLFFLAIVSTHLCM